MGGEAAAAVFLCRAGSCRRIVSWCFHSIALSPPAAAAATCAARELNRTVICGSGIRLDGCYGA